MQPCPSSVYKPRRAPPSVGIHGKHMVDRREYIHSWDRVGLLEVSSTTLQECSHSIPSETCDTRRNPWIHPSSDSLQAYWLATLQMHNTTNSGQADDAAVEINNGARFRCRTKRSRYLLTIEYYRFKPNEINNDVRRMDKNRKMELQID